MQIERCSVRGINPVHMWLLPSMRVTQPLRLVRQEPEPSQATDAASWAKS